MCEPTKMENFENYIPIDTNGKNLEQCTDIPRKRNKILKLLQCDKVEFIGNLGYFREQIEISPESREVSLTHR